MISKEEIQKKYQLVVARYNEDIQWLLPFKDIVYLYNKGNNIHPSLDSFKTIALPNVGRESHTYLTHIVDNYDNLAEHVLFFQAHIDDHKRLPFNEYFGESSFVGKKVDLEIQSLQKRIPHFGKWKEMIRNGNMKLSEHTPYDFIKYLLGINIPDNIKATKIVWSALFSVSREVIHQKPLYFYQNALRYISHHVNPEEGHFFERCWYSMFHFPMLEKKRIGYIYIPFLTDLVYQRIKPTLDRKIAENNLEKIQLWTYFKSSKQNLTVKPVNYMNSSNQFLSVYNNPFSFHDQKINFQVKSEKDVLIKVNDLLEIHLGAMLNKKCLLKNKKGEIIQIVDISILNKNNYVPFSIWIEDNHIVLQSNEKQVIKSQIENLENNITNLKVKSSFGNESFWIWESEQDKNIQLMVQSHENSNLFDYYSTHEHHVYTEKIELIELI